MLYTHSKAKPADDWTDEKEITIVGDGPEETSAHRLGFETQPTVYRTRVSVASEEPSTDSSRLVAEMETGSERLH